MFKYALLIGIALPGAAFAADYSITNSRHCMRQQSGYMYCVERPVEKYITNCDAGVDCHHMQSGQHYSVQTPVLTDG